MIKTIKYIFLLQICLSYFRLSAQDSHIDSLLSIIKTANDTQKIDALNDLGWEYRTIDMNLAFRYSQEALKLAEKSGSKKRAARSLNNIGAVYEIQNKHQQAMEHFKSALKIQEELGNKKEIASMTLNLGIIYAEQGMLDTARTYMSEALEIDMEIGNKKSIANALMNIGGTYQVEKKYAISLDHYIRSLKISEELNDITAAAKCTNNIAYVYYITNENEKAESYLNKSLEYADKIKDGAILQSDYEILSAVFAAKKQFDKAYKYHVTFTKIKDSLAYNESSKQVQALQAKYETEKKEKEIEKLNREKEKQAILTGEDSKRKNIIIISVILGLLITIIFIAFLSNRFQITKKQKLIIEEKNKEILDSIHYAKRIQNSLLPTEKYIDKTIKRLIKKE